MEGLEQQGETRNERETERFEGEGEV